MHARSDGGMHASRKFAVYMPLQVSYYAQCRGTTDVVTRT